MVGVGAWLTVTVCEVAPVAEIVTVAERLVEEVFALLAVTVTVLLSEPLVGEQLNQL